MPVCIEKFIGRIPLYRYFVVGAAPSWGRGCWRPPTRFGVFMLVRILQTHSLLLEILLSLRVLPFQFSPPYLTAFPSEAGGLTPLLSQSRPLTQSATNIVKDFLVTRLTSSDLGTAPEESLYVYLRFTALAWLKQMRFDRHTMFYV